MARNPAADPNPAMVAEQQQQAFKLKLDGHSVRDIADKMGLPKSTVQERLQAEYDAMVKPVAEEVRQVELARLDRWQVRLEDRLAADEDPVKVIPIAIKVQERRARYLPGVETPLEQAVTVDTSAETAALLARARKVREAQ